VAEVGLGFFFFFFRNHRPQVSRIVRTERPTSSIRSRERNNVEGGGEDQTSDLVLMDVAGRRPSADRTCRTARVEVMSSRVNVRKPACQFSISLPMGAYAAARAAQLVATIAEAPPRGLYCVKYSRLVSRSGGSAIARGLQQGSRWSARWFCREVPTSAAEHTTGRYSRTSLTASAARRHLEVRKLSNGAAHGRPG